MWIMFLFSLKICPAKAQRNKKLEDIERDCGF